MASLVRYVADMIDLACDASILTSLGCDETCLIELFVTQTQSELQAGKRKWEGRTDRSLIDYVTKELTWPSGTYAAAEAHLMDSDCVPHHQLADCVGLRLIGSDYVPLIRYTHLKRLIYLLYKGDRDESDTSDAARAAEQAQQLHDECA